MSVSSKPYLIRAMYDWILDNGWVPYLLVDAHHPEVQVPGEHVSPDGRIVLNISPEATRGLHMSNDRVVFTARFSGVSFQIFIPPEAVKAIYAKENGRGMMFGEDEDTPPGGPPVPPEPSARSTSRPSHLPSGKNNRKTVLKVVK